MTDTVLDQHIDDALGELHEPAPARIPKPGDADYDWSPHYNTTDLYHHAFKDGTVVAIRSMAAINNKTWLYKMRDVKSDGQFVVLAITRASCEAADRVLMNLDDTDGDPISELWDAWLAAGTSRDGDEGLTAGN